MGALSFTVDGPPTRPDTKSYNRMEYFAWNTSPPGAAVLAG